ncbi:MAG TPA: hypothetical protein PLO14_04120 [Accumulibacter sp.]|nr:hypothetical protein [Accumulibacter sp.]
MLQAALVIAGGEQGAGAKERVVGVDLAPQALANESGEQRRAPLQRGVALLREQQLEVIRRTEEIELVAAAQLAPQLAGALWTVEPEEVFDLAVAERFNPHMRYRQLGARQRRAVVEATAGEDRARAGRQFAEEIAPLRRSLAVVAGVGVRQFVDRVEQQDEPAAGQQIAERWQLRVAPFPFLRQPLAR